MATGLRSSAGTGLPTWFHALLITLAACSYGAVSTVLKLAYQHGFHTAELTSAQYDIALVILWAIVPFANAGTRVAGRQRPLLLFIGLFGVVTSFAYYRCLHFLPASLAIVLLFQFTWMVPVIDMLVRQRWLTASKWMGLAAILTGTVCAVGLGRHALAHVGVWGVAFGLLSGLFYGLQLYLSGYVDERTPPALRTALIITVAGGVASFVAPPTWLYDGRLWQGLWLYGLLAALFAQVIPMLLMSISIPVLGGRMASVLGAAELPTAVLLASLLLHEPIGVEQWLGIGLILAGMLISEGTGLWRKEIPPA